MNYIGIDIGKEKCVVCVIGEDDDKKETMSYENTYASALECAKSLNAKYGECEATCEATGDVISNKDSTLKVPKISRSKCQLLIISRKPVDQGCGCL